MSRFTPIGADNRLYALKTAPYRCDRCDGDEYSCDCEPEPMLTRASPAELEAAIERIRNAFKTQIVSPERKAA